MDGGRLHSFSGIDGGFVSAGVAAGAGGVLYGTTSLAGSGGDGTVYSLTPPDSGSAGAWAITILHAFTGSDGNSPAAGVTIGSGGVLYGTTTIGGASNDGLVYSFTGPPGGSTPYATLAIANDALFSTTNQWWSGGPGHRVRAALSKENGGPPRILEICDSQW
jgi:hypothetical protein